MSTKIHPFERLAGAPLREPPRRLPVPRSPLMVDCAKGGGEFRQLAGLIAPLVDVESAEAQFIAAGYILRLARPKTVGTADVSPLRGGLSDQTRTIIMNFVRGFDPELVAEAEVALCDRAEVLIEKLELVSQEDDVPCNRNLALDICRLRSEMEMLEVGLRMYGRSKPNIARRVDALGIGRLPWLREAIGDFLAEEGDRWSEELIDAPEAWWAEAMLSDD